ncbi:MAG: PHP domain-containing protein [Candidatus Brocadiia bacterium]|jgi:predicted metal-dependent phosphoesterase TrpH
MTVRKPHGADLHLHTVYSDGVYTPETLVAAARERDLLTIALTDHDSVDGVEPTRRAARDTGLGVIAGAEFGVPVSDEGDEEIHLVGLFLDVESAALREGLLRNRAQRKQRVMEMIEKLNRIGVTLRTEDVLNLAAPGNVTRLHLARALVQTGRVRSVRTAFKRWLRPGTPAFVPRSGVPAAEVIALIHRAGGLAIMAHPGKTLRDGEIPALAQAGLDALEAYCPDHSASQELHYLKLAAQYGLLAGAGSDCHGDCNGRILIGKVRLHEDQVEALRARAATWREPRHG